MQQHAEVALHPQQLIAIDFCN